MLNITRIYNTCAAVGYMLKMTDLAVQYSKSRSLKDTRLLDMPLQTSVLADLQVSCQGCLILTLQLGMLLSKQQAGTATS